MRSTLIRSAILLACLDGGVAFAQAPLGEEPPPPPVPMPMPPPTDVPPPPVYVPPPPTALSPPPPMATLPPPLLGGARFFVRSAGRPQDVQLIPDTFSGVPAPPPCRTPCSLTLPPGTYSLRAQAPGVRTTVATFQVPPEGLGLRVRAGSKGAYAGGVLLTIFGSLMAPTGFVYGAAAGSGNDYPAFEVGMIVGGIGLALLVPGIVLLALNKKGIVEEPLETAAQP